MIYYESVHHWSVFLNHCSFKSSGTGTDTYPTYVPYLLPPISGYRYRMLLVHRRHKPCRLVLYLKGSFIVVKDVGR